MHLTDLVPGPVTAHPDAGRIGKINVTGISSDSRAVASGPLFVALRGSSGAGRAYAAGQPSRPHDLDIFIAAGAAIGAALRGLIADTVLKLTQPV
ncbi:MAG: hypothetical protein MK030_04325, partial [SAR116 cluster bacterium]|nr:hypothetical protein [SAR116 cluster bacterium]